MNRCGDDNSFGPTLGHSLDCYDFDFTLYFEDCIFSLVPAVLSISVALRRIYSLLGRPRAVQWPVGRALKQVRESLFLEALDYIGTRFAHNIPDNIRCTRSVPDSTGRTLEAGLWNSDAAHHTSKCYRHYKHFSACCSLKPGARSGTETVLGSPDIPILCLSPGIAPCADTMAARRQEHHDSVVGDSDLSLEASASCIGVGR